MIYPERFEGKTRDVILEGEAYFMVAKNRRQPFVVHTPHGEVNVYGTDFNVEARDERTEVVLVNGSVGLTPTGGGRLMMEPGQKATIDSAHPVPVVETVDTEPYVAWNTGVFAFRYEPLWKVTDVLSKWYNVEFRFDTDDLRDVVIVGNFDRYEQLDIILSSISKSTGLTIGYENGVVDIGR